MHDGALMDAVEFLRVHLIGVDHRGGKERQPLACAPHGRLGDVAATRGHVEHFAAPRRARAGDADTESIRNKGLGRRARRLRHLPGSDAREVRDNLVDDGIHYRQFQIRRSGESRDPPVSFRAGGEVGPGLAAGLRFEKRLRNPLSRRQPRQRADIGEGIEAEDRLAQFTGPR